MAPAIADRRPKYVTKSCYVPMSESGQNATYRIVRDEPLIPQLQI